MTLRKWNRSYAASPVSTLRDVVAVNAQVYTESMRVFTTVLDYSPVAAFRDRPLWVGLGKGEIVFASANDCRRLRSITLPGAWLKSNRAKDPVDYRFRPKLTLDMRSAFFDTVADNTRNLAILTFSEHLVLAPVEKMELPDEPSLLVRTSLPDEVTPGRLLRVQLELEAESEDVVMEDVVFEFVPNPDWLPNERQKLLGTGPSPRLLELSSALDASASTLRLKSSEPLKGLKLPYRLRVGNEVMLVTGYDKYSLKLQRSQPFYHSGSPRVAVVDEVGRELLAAETGPVIPPGKRLVLSAMVNNQQEILFVNDVSPVSGEKLPVEIQVEDEKMIVTEVDQLRSALTVRRRKPVNHSVTSVAFVVVDAKSRANAGPSLPVVKDRTFTWKPTADQAGMNTIRMRDRAEGMTHEWYWDVTVREGRSSRR